MPDGTRPTEKRVLANSEKLSTAALSAYDQLYDSGTSAEVSLRAALRSVEELARYDARFEESVQQLASARATIGDLSSSLRDYAEHIDASPERLAEIEDRLAAIDRLKRKYGSTVAEVIAFGEDVARKLAEVEDRHEILKQLRAELASAASAYRTAATALTTDRKTAATKLAKLAESQINSLAMKVRFEIDVHSVEASAKGTGFSPYIETEKKEGASAPEATWSPNGWDTIEFRISTNPGEPLKPLTEIASGGEMSRVMLALKVAVEEASAKTRKKNPTPRTLVFDEIDIGIGGRAAEAVGQKLKSLSRAQQILCVTHLPQIAAFADQHLLIDKREDHGRTKTNIRLLDQRASTHEVARMLSGAKVTETSLQHAAQMIAASK
jgi:DNA repair protein RecN (Recombination protein N)